MKSNYIQNQNLIEIGKRIQKYRTAAKLTQEQLAEIIGISQTHLSRMEQGYHNPHFDIIIAIAKAVNIPIDFLADDYENTDSMSFFNSVKADLEELTPKQLEMLKDTIYIIKKYTF